MAKWLGLVILIPSLLFNVYFAARPKSDQSIKVLEVLDGDTILLEGKVRLRLRHIDAPELENCLGQEAKDYLENLVKDERITVQEYIIDQRGRPLAMVYLGNELINQTMLESGLVRFHHDQTNEADKLKAIAAEIKVSRQGVYSQQCYQEGENPENPDCNIKGNIDGNNASIKRYYFPGCAQYNFVIVEKDKGEKWFCSEKEAQEAGYTKAKSCPK